MTTSIDDLIALLTAARDQAQAEADAAIDRHGALDRALGALCPVEVPAWVAAPIVAAIAEHASQPTVKASSAPKPATKGRTLTDRQQSAQLAAAVRVNCPECGKQCSQLGVGTHRRKAHGYSATPTLPAFSPADAMSLLEQTG